MAVVVVGHGLVQRLRIVPDEHVARLPGVEILTHCLISTQVHGLETPEAGKRLLNMLLAHATSPAFQYFHAWEAGDVLIWDNSQTLHQSMPYDNDGRARREYYRSQARIRPPAVPEL